MSPQNISRFVFYNNCLEIDLFFNRNVLLLQKSLEITQYSVASLCEYNIKIYVSRDESRDMNIKALATIIQRFVRF